MKQQIFQTNSSEATQKLGQKIARKIIENGLQEKAIILALEGELGGGKTTFTQGFALGFDIKEKITSPTFVIQKRFSLANLPFGNLYHIDCYRLSRAEEILELGWLEIINKPSNIVIVEWPEKIKEVLPENVIEISFKLQSENKRKITLNNFKL